MNTKKNNHTNEYVQVMVKINIYKNNDKSNYKNTQNK